jgi:hypothetical protein
MYPVSTSEDLAFQTELISYSSKRGCTCPLRISGINSINLLLYGYQVVSISGSKMLPKTCVHFIA